MKTRQFVYIGLFVFFVYLPLLANPPLFLERGNDLQEFFWPIIFFVKKTILTIHQVPFWNPTFLSGTPLLPDPQSPLFYFPNLIFLFLNIDFAFVCSILIHSFIGGVGMYLLTKKIHASFLYIASPILASFLEAGHFGLIQAFAWLPFALYFALNLKNARQSALLSICLALIYFTHLPTFLIVAFIVSLLGLKNPRLLFLSLLLLSGLVTISLLPQLEWQPATTRSILIQNPDIYPKWSSKLEFIKAIVTPWLVNNITTEKIITLGVFPLILAGLGFINASLSKKILIGILLLFFLLLSLGVASPIYSFLVKNPYFDIMRVSSRFFIPIFLLAIFLASKINNKILVALAIIESVLLSWSLLAKQTQTTSYAPKEVYEFLSSDHDLFRVFCLTRCLSQKYASIYNLQLVDGYTTLPQKNIYHYGWEITDSFWDYYTLSIPPQGLYKFDKIQPDAKHLGLLNNKYIISPYELNDENLTLIKRIDNFLIYKNLLFEPRASGGELINYQPDELVVKTDPTSTKVIFSEIASPGWKAMVDDKPANILNSPLVFRSVEISPGIHTVRIKYLPDSFKLGLIITSATLAFVLYLTLIYKTKEYKVKRKLK